MYDVLLHFRIQTKHLSLSHFWFELNLLPSNRYSQTRLNDHLYKTTICLIRPMLSLPKPILIQSLWYKMTTCLTRPSTTLWDKPQMKKNLFKTATAKPLSSREMGSNAWKINVSVTIITLLLLYSAEFNVYQNWTFTLNINLPNYCSVYGAGFPIEQSEFKTTGLLQGQPSLSSFWHWSNEYQ